MQESGESKKIELLEEERQLFEVLLGARDRQGKGTVLRVAGGWVRDKLLKRESNDIDIALDNQPGLDFASSLNDFLQGEGYETHRLAVITANPDQSKHIETAVVKVLGFDIDFVNLRSETYSEESRIPSIQFGSPAEDAERRDFTINALFYNIDTQMIEDYTKKGLSDLSLRIIRTPVNPLVTFRDDPLRILRAIRFSSRYAFSFDGALVGAARNSEIHETLKHKVSRERIYKELKPMICQEANNAARPLLAIASLYYLGIFGIVFCIPTLPEMTMEEGSATQTANVFRLSAQQQAESVQAIAARWEANSFETCLWYGVLRSWRQNESKSTEDMDVCHVGDESARSTSQHIASPPTSVTVEELVATSSETTLGFSRVMYLASAMNGLRPLFTVDKKKMTRVPQVILRDGLKTDIDTMRTVQAVHDSITQFQSLQRNLHANGKDTFEISREEAGLLLRTVRELWEEVLWLACADELVQSQDLCMYKQWRAHISCKDTKMPDSVHDWSDILFNIDVQEPAAALVSRYAELAAAIRATGLDGSWHLKPLMDGKTLMTKLPGLKKGPLIGKIMDAQLRWQLRHGPQGTEEDCIAYLASVILQHRDT